MTSTIKVNNVQNQCGQNIINENSNTITLGASGDTIALASGASQTGFGRSGSFDWQTTPKTSTFTAADGEGYFINSGSALTMNLPAGSAGAIVAVSDYARNFATYNLTISPNGSEKIGGVAQDATLNINGQAATFVYVDSTKGWINVQNAEDTETGVPEAYITATGGNTVSTVCTNYKVHIFTGPGTFCISAGSGSLAKLDYQVVAGGGGGGGSKPGFWSGGGGGAGGFRESKTSSVSGCWTASPLASSTSLGPFSGPTAIPVTVGAGGTAGTGNPSFSGRTSGGDGADSVFSTITSAGGGGGSRAGGPGNTTISGATGGSGGGTGGYANPTAGGAGNTPPVSPPQGQPGGTGSAATDATGGGGGGAGGAGGNNSPPYGGGCGGATITSSITSSPVARAGGGESGKQDGGTDNGGANTGTGAQGGTCNPDSGGTGGSGIVIIRYRFQ